MSGSAGDPGSPRIIALGDNVVDCYPDLGVMFPGGNALNVAVHAHRVGARAAYAGALGTDQAGGLVHDALVTEGVDTSLVRVVPGANAYAVVRLVEGNRVFGAGDIGVSRFSVSEADLAASREADLVHTGECSMLEDDLDRLAGAARRLSFDFSERPWAYVAEHAPKVDVAVLSAASTEARPEELVAGIAALGPSIVAVTQGAAGATLWVEGRLLHAEAGSGPIVDTLGAGDAFIARFLVGLARDEEPAGLLHAATAYATRSCGEHGAFGYRAALPAGLVASGEVSASP